MPSLSVIVFVRHSAAYDNICHNGGITSLNFSLSTPFSNKLLGLMTQVEPMQAFIVSIFFCVTLILDALFYSSFDCSGIELN